MADNGKISIGRYEKVVRKGNLFVMTTRKMAFVHVRNGIWRTLIREIRDAYLVSVTKGVRMAKYDKKAALQIIVNAAKEFNVKLNDKHFLIVYQESGQTKTVCVGFRDMNFLHMTGVKTRLSAQQFYSACLDGKLSENDFEIDKKGKVQQKLTVLPELSELLYNNCMIGNFINSGICIRADYFVGNTKAVLSVGFRRGKSVDFPVSLYSEDVRKLSQPTDKVLAIFAKDYQQRNYTECTYLSKGQEIYKLPILEEVKKLIQVEERI